MAPLPYLAAPLGLCAVAATLSGCGADEPVPTQRPGFAAVATGAEHTCAITTTGEVRCWGEGSDGQLGNGSLDDRWEPQGIEGLDRPRLEVIPDF